MSRLKLFFLAAEMLKTCPGHKIPKEVDVENENLQILRLSNVAIKMFNAYYDERGFYARQNQSVVKIIASIELFSPKVETFCQLWFVGLSAPIVSEVYEYKLMWLEDYAVNEIGSQPYLVTCLNPLVNLGLIPSGVSLVVRDCDLASNYLEVIYNPPEIGMVKPVAVCVKLYDVIEDQTVTIVEWIETLLLLGVDKAFLYVNEIYPNMMKALEFYQIAGKVRLEVLSLPGGPPDRNQSQTQRYHNDVILYTDCLYKHVYEYSFLVPLDIDEIILPTGRGSETWIDLLTLVIQAGRLIKDELYSGYLVRNGPSVFDNKEEGELQPDVPSDLDFLRAVHRPLNFSKVGLEPHSFQNTKSLAVMSKLLPMHCLGKNFCDYFYIPTETAQLQHFQRDFMNEKNMANDSAIWKFKEELFENVNETLRSLVDK